MLQPVPKLTLEEKALFEGGMLVGAVLFLAAMGVLSLIGGCWW